MFKIKYVGVTGIQVNYLLLQRNKPSLRKTISYMRIYPNIYPNFKFTLPLPTLTITFPPPSLPFRANILLFTSIISTPLPITVMLPPRPSCIDRCHDQLCTEATGAGVKRCMRAEREGPRDGGRLSAHGGDILSNRDTRRFNKRPWKGHMDATRAGLELERRGSGWVFGGRVRGHSYGDAPRFCGDGEEVVEWIRAGYGL